MSQSTVCALKQRIGKPVEDFQLVSINDEKMSLQSVLTKKKGVVIVFWSGVCSHCVRYDGYLNGFAEEHPNIGIVAVASREQETVSELRATRDKRKLTFPILHDPGGRLAKRWSAQQTPRAYLIDANHVLLYRGALDNYKYPGDIEYVPYLERAVLEFTAGGPLTRNESASFGCAIDSIYYNLPKAL